MDFTLHVTEMCVCLGCIWAKDLYNNASKLFLQGQQNCMPTGLWWTSEKPTISLLWTVSSSIMRAPEEVRKSMWNCFQLCVYLIRKMEQCIHRFHLNLPEPCREDCHDLQPACGIWRSPPGSLRAQEQQLSLSSIIFHFVAHKHWREVGVSNFVSLLIIIKGKNVNMTR